MIAGRRYTPNSRSAWSSNDVKVSHLLLSLVLLVLLSGCGQKGPLYLPAEQDEGEEEQQEGY